jgi:hypothetical protein
MRVLTTTADNHQLILAQERRLNTTRYGQTQVLRCVWKSANLGKLALASRLLVLHIENEGELKKGGKNKRGRGRDQEGAVVKHEEGTELKLLMRKTLLTAPVTASTIRLDHDNVHIPLQIAQNSIRLPNALL